MTFIRLGAIIVLSSFALLWSTPLWWMLVAALRDLAPGQLSDATLLPGSPTLAHFSDAWQQGDFFRWYLNSGIVVLGILVVQLITITLAGYAFARLNFPGRDLVFYLFLAQIALAAPLLIVPNTVTIVRMGLYDSLLGVMAPYFASAFGIFLMRQTFKTIPRDFEEAAIVDGASLWQLIRLVLVPLARPGLVAFSIISLTSHWNEFLWPLMITDSPDNMVLTVGLASFVRSAEQAADWGLVAAATLLVAAPLLTAFVLFQRQFVNSFVFSGVK
jgi:sn-glycerol 3-phosphate transport system permease protein